MVTRFWTTDSSAGGSPLRDAELSGRALSSEGSEVNRSDPSGSSSKEDDDPDSGTDPREVAREVAREDASDVSVERSGRHRPFLVVERTDTRLVSKPFSHSALDGRPSESLRLDFISILSDFSSA